MSDELLGLRAQLERARHELAARGEASERLERRLADARTDARAVAQRNEKLTVALREARTAFVALRERVEALGQPPATFGVVTAVHPADAQADVSLAGRALRVALSPEVDAAGLRVGQWVLLNEAMTLVGIAVPPAVGDAVRVREVLESGQVVVSTNGDEEVVMLAAPSLDAATLQPGDALLADRRVGVAWARLDRSNVEDLELLAVPDVTYADIGGLAEQIDEIRDAVELPFAHRDLFARYGLAAPKGILLYGPPGCGKTMIAKAVANAAGSAFLNVKGPELLNKYVGETERQIRQIFARARELAGGGRPVIVFFDEMDSLFRTRGTGISSDVESTIVPQLLAEIDGVEALADVIVIGATNREDLIDPAILRPGRLDVKIKLARPSREGASEILGKYLDPSLPLDAAEVAAAGGEDALRARLVDAAVERLYARDTANEFVEVTYASGEREVLYVSDFVSGAMLANVAARAKKAAIKDVLAGGAGGLRVAHLRDACAAEIADNEDLPNTTNPDDWARISGRKGEKIVFLRTLHGSRALEV